MGRSGGEREVIKNEGERKGEVGGDEGEEGEECFRSGRSLGGSGERWLRKPRNR